MVSHWRSPGLFWVFWPISTMLWSVWSRFFFWFPIPPVFFRILWRLFQMHQLQLASPTPSCFSVFFVLWQDPSIRLSFRFLLFSQRCPLDYYYYYYLLYDIILAKSFSWGPRKLSAILKWESFLKYVSRSRYHNLLYFR